MFTTSPIGQTSDSRAALKSVWRPLQYWASRMANRPLIFHQLPFFFLFSLPLDFCAKSSNCFSLILQLGFSLNLIYVFFITIFFI